MRGQEKFVVLPCPVSCQSLPVALWWINHACCVQLVKERSVKMTRMGSPQCPTTVGAREDPNGSPARQLVL